MSYHEEDYSPPKSNPDELFSSSVPSMGDKKISPSSHSSFYGRANLADQLFPREPEVEQNNFKILDPANGFPSFGGAEDFGDGFPERQRNGSSGRDFVDDLSFHASNLSLGGGSGKSNHSQQFNSLPQQQQFEDYQSQRQGQMSESSVFRGMNELGMNQQMGGGGGNNFPPPYGQQNQFAPQGVMHMNGGGGRGMGGNFPQDNFGPQGGNMGGRGGFGGGANYSQDPYQNQQYQQNSVSPRFPGRHASHHDTASISATGVGGAQSQPHIFSSPDVGGALPRGEDLVLVCLF
jgi:hypothetical protein